MQNERQWNEALRLIHKFIPESRASIRSPRVMSVDSIYRLTHCRSLHCHWEYFNVGLPSEKLLYHYTESELSRKYGRVIAIHDLLTFKVPPIVCSINRVLERITEGVLDPYGDSNRICEFIGGGDTLFVFESTGKLVLFDHDDKVCIATRKN